MTETSCSKLGIELFVGVPCVIFSQEKKVRFRASVRYIGYIQGVSWRLAAADGPGRRTDYTNSYMGHGLESK